MIYSIILALFLLATRNTYGTELKKEGCRRIISDVHIANLSDLIDSQMKSSCLESFAYLDEKELNGHPVCFLKAAYSPLGKILNKMKFKRSTPNFDKLEQLKHIYDKLERDSCIIPEDEEEIKNCIKIFTLPVEEMLQLVRNYFLKAQKALSQSSDFDKDCSHVFETCSDRKRQETSTLGVVTDQNCKCPGTSPVSGGPSTSPSTFEPLSSITDQLDSKDTAASSFQIAMLPGTTMSYGSLEGSTKPRVPRSTDRGSRTSDNLDLGTGIVMSSPPAEVALADVSQGPDPVPLSTASSLPSTIAPYLWSSKFKSIPPFPSSQQHFEFTGMEPPLPDSGADSSQTNPNELPSQYPFSGLAKPSPTNQWLQTREVDTDIPGSTSDWDIADTSSTSSLNLASLANLEPVDSSRVPSSGKLVPLPPSGPALFPDTKESVSAAHHLSTRLVVATQSSSSPRPIITKSYSWGEWGSRGRASGIQHSTQVRERRAGQEEGLAKDREPKDSMPGPNFDLSFIPPNTDQYREKPEPRDIQGTASIYVPVASVLGVLLAVGGLLFYLHRNRVSARRRLQRIERVDIQEGRPLNRGEDVELQIQDEL